MGGDWRLFPRYDRVLYLDADVIVRGDYPDLFATVPPECVGGQDEVPLNPLVAEYLCHFSRPMMGQPAQCPHYINGGVFVVSSRHEGLFRDPEAILEDVPCPKQTHLNLRIMMDGVPMCSLPLAFNDRYRQGDLRTSFILHYCALPKEVRMEWAHNDLAGWRQLLRRGRRGGFMCGGVVRTRRWPGEWSR